MRVRPTNLLILATLPAFGLALAPFVPVRHWLVDLPACFPVQAGAFLLLSALLLLLGRRYRWALACLAGTLVAALAVVPGWFAARRAFRQEGHPLRVLSLNLLRDNEVSAPQALAVVRQHAPAVVFCAEVTTGWLTALRAGLPDYPHRIDRADEGYFGVALFSKLPLRDAAVIPLAFDWAPTIRAVVVTPIGEVGVLGVHPPRPGMGNRCEQRDAALAAIPGALAPLPELRVVLGDCNATPWNGAFRELLATAGLVDAGGETFRPTWTTDWPWWLRVPIDHVLVGAGIGVAAVSAEPLFGSDHAPLFADLRLPGQAPGK